MATKTKKTSVKKDTKVKPKKVPRTATAKKTPPKAPQAAVPSKSPRKSSSIKKTTVSKSVLQIPSEEKQDIINKFQVKQGDTGSPEVQAALLTNRIAKLVSHLKGNPSDNHSRRGLLGIVSKRRRLLNYLEKKDKARYKSLIAKLGLA